MHNSLLQANIVNNREAGPAVENNLMQQEQHFELDDE